MERLFWSRMRDMMPPGISTDAQIAHVTRTVGLLMVLMSVAACVGSRSPGTTTRGIADYDGLRIHLPKSFTPRLSGVGTILPYRGEVFPYVIEAVRFDHRDCSYGPRCTYRLLVDAFLDLNRERASMVIEQAAKRLEKWAPGIRRDESGSQTWLTVSVTAGELTDHKWIIFCWGNRTLWKLTFSGAGPTRNFRDFVHAAVQSASFGRYTNAEKRTAAYKMMRPEKKLPN